MGRTGETQYQGGKAKLFWEGIGKFLEKELRKSGGSQNGKADRALVGVSRCAWKGWKGPFFFSGGASPGTRRGWLGLRAVKNRALGREGEKAQRVGGREDVSSDAKSQLTMLKGAGEEGGGV